MIFRRPARISNRPRGCSRILPGHDEQARHGFAPGLASLIDAGHVESQESKPPDEAKRQLNAEAKQETERRPLLYEIGVFLSETGENDVARECLERSLVSSRKVLGNENLRTADMLEALGVVCLQVKDYATARACHEEELKVRHALLPPDHPEIAQTLEQLGLTIACQGEYGGGAALFQEALAIKKNVGGLGGENRGFRQQPGLDLRGVRRLANRRAPYR